MFGCKKYKDNPLINLSGKEARLQGTYYLAAYKIEGVDLTHSIKLDSSLTIDKFNFIIGKDTRSNFSPLIGGPYLSGRCVWMDHKRNLTFFLQKTCFKEGPLSEYASQEYKILKLTDHQLVLEIIYHGEKYEIFFFKE